MSKFSLLLSNNKQLQPIDTGFENYNLIFINELTQDVDYIVYGQLVYKNLEPANCLEIGEQYHIRILTSIELSSPSFDPDLQTTRQYLYMSPYIPYNVFNLQSSNNLVYTVFQVISIVSNNSAVFKIYNKTYPDISTELNISFVADVENNSPFVGQPDWNCSMTCKSNQCIDYNGCDGKCGASCSGNCDDKTYNCVYNNGNYSCVYSCSGECSSFNGNCYGRCNNNYHTCIVNGEIYECSENIDGCGITCGWNNGECEGECPQGYVCIQNDKLKYNCIATSGTCGGDCGGRCYGKCGTGKECMFKNGLFYCETNECKECGGLCFGSCGVNKKCVYENGEYRCIDMDENDVCYNAPCGGTCNGKCEIGNCIINELGEYYCDETMEEGLKIPFWVWIIVSIIILCIILVILYLVIKALNNKNKYSVVQDNKYIENIPTNNNKK